MPFLFALPPRPHSTDVCAALRCAGGGGVTDCALQMFVDWLPALSCSFLISKMRVGLESDTLAGPSNSDTVTSTKQPADQ